MAHWDNGTVKKVQNGKIKIKQFSQFGFYELRFGHLICLYHELDKHRHTHFSS